MMEKPGTEVQIVTQPSLLRTSNVDDEDILELNEHELQQLFQSIDDIMGPGNTHFEPEIRNNQSSNPKELSNTTAATATFLQDFEEFEKSYLSACGSGDASIDDSILQDFEVFEKTMLPPISRDNMDHVDDDILASIDGGEGTEEVEEMVNEMADDGNRTILIPASYDTMDNMDNDFVVSNVNGEGTEEDISEMVNEMVDDGNQTILTPVSYGNMDDGVEGTEEDNSEMVNEMIDYGNETINFIAEEDDSITFNFDDSDYDEYDFGMGGSAWGGVDPLMAPHGGAKRVHYIKCSGDTKRQPQSGTRIRKKRKYRGVIETEEQTAKRMETTKIRNREAATKAHERKKEYEACLQALLQKLRKKNKYLKNFIKFLDCQKREDLQVKPLRRTLSGLM